MSLKSLMFLIFTFSMPLTNIFADSLETPYFTCIFNEFGERQKPVHTTTVEVGGRDFKSLESPNFEATASYSNGSYLILRIESKADRSVSTELVVSSHLHLPIHSPEKHDLRFTAKAFAQLICLSQR